MRKFKKKYIYINTIIFFFLIIIFSTSCQTEDSQTNSNNDIQETSIEKEKEIDNKNKINTQKGNEKETSKPTKLQIWFHSQSSDTGKAISKLIEKFNSQQNKILIETIFLPEGNYKEFVSAKAQKGELPDILDIDGPDLANYVWKGYLIPLDNLINKKMFDDFLPSIIKQGTIEGSLYALGQFDSGLAICGNKNYLKKANIRIPKSVDDAWSKEEFVSAMEKLKNIKEIKYPIDMKLSYGPQEYYTYAFSPLIQSYNGGLIDRTDYSHSEGILNGDDTVQALTDFQNWIEKGYVVPENGNRTSFEDKESGLSWFGHWMYNSYERAIGDDLVIIPMLKIKKQVTGMGSYCWGITTKCSDVTSAWQFLEFLLSAENMLYVSQTNNSVPARRSSLALSDLHKEKGKLNIFAQQLEKIAIPRPKTPAYPIISREFRKVIKNIAKGEEVKNQLDQAVNNIDNYIKKNNFFK